MNESLWHTPPILPAPLAEADILQVVHLAGAVQESKLQAGREILRARGLNIRWDPGAHCPTGYLAASDAQRAQEWARALAHPRVRALLCARGGYGSMRILDALRPVQNAEHMPWLVGYSDITALHLWLNSQGIASIHGPMVSGFPRYGKDGGQELDHLLALLRSGAPTRFEGLRTLHAGRAKGRLIGGNLSLLQALIGTAYLPHLAGAILLIEEIAEPAYRIDRMLQSLALSSRARGLQGIVFADFTHCHGLDDRQMADRLKHWSARFECPVAMGLPAGHGARNESVMLGVDMELDTTAGSLTPCQSLNHTTPPAPDHRGTTIVIPPAKAPIGAGDMATVSVAPGRVVGLLIAMLDAGVCSAVQLVASQAGEITHNLSMGTTAVTPDAAIAPVTPHTRFDLASVTKAVGTAILAHQCLQDGTWALDDTLPARLHGCGTTLAQLLSHRSGLPAWKRLYDDARTHCAPREWLAAQWRSLTPDAPPNTQCVYSDPGYILLGMWLESVAHKPLDVLFADRIATPLALTRTGYLQDPASPAQRAAFAATEWCPWRGQTLQGLVHDEHTQVMGGISGHAGLFSTAMEVDRIARSLLGYGPAILSSKAIRTMWSTPAFLCEGGYTLGWDTPTVQPSNAGSRMTPGHTVGHLGYAGTSLWIDFERDIAITLLTNRVHPSRKPQFIRTFRPIVHDAIMGELGVGPAE